ncbi:NADH dehydrogenase [ubiquinone] 1 alpha subcomplex assembly factor 2 isoform X2 [Schistocerca americana]|uniref:NADH dehydrogenase [ubiquinone] 1 alpha subcomplex assembly factor 2 isoform X2 n=2 Tax=Schistocerca americana TaxID=7009 RepID=UPI001F4FA194|nr:NADH dehydrogenase [ubiquinone] 1 alpha subcomplex assembly factor 2 isoform X2 [Schistocerca americana]XP_047120679.1 NADH dehydrogenase [ubiquinone] 1 alpha subcomplex assembly factor 2 isoform X2 [Schistocerca piceifrons]XP_049957955.1 NADH dehydrogenase [ubiquinone] 1 alpha subcomplex assembly factor 2 isoform X1 [Schistocerca serialis cubense]
MKTYGMAKEGRSIIGMIFKNFIQSLKPRQIRGTPVGTDYLGNKYFEIPANPSVGKRKASRWFEPAVKDNFEQEIPAEWEAWLRGRRTAPPMEEEIMRSVAIMEMKKKNAAELARKEGKKDPGVLDKEVKGMESFPKYDEYEVMPGKSKEADK